MTASTAAPHPDIPQLIYAKFDLIDSTERQAFIGAAWPVWQRAQNIDDPVEATSKLLEALTLPGGWRTIKHIGLLATCVDEIGFLSDKPCGVATAAHRLAPSNGRVHVELGAAGVVPDQRGRGVGAALGVEMVRGAFSETPVLDPQGFLEGLAKGTIDGPPTEEIEPLPDTDMIAGGFGDLYGVRGFLRAICPDVALMHIETIEASKLR